MADILCCKPSELAFYPIPKLMIRRVGDHEAHSATRAVSYSREQEQIGNPHANESFGVTSTWLYGYEVFIGEVFFFLFGIVQPRVIAIIITLERFGLMVLFSLTLLSSSPGMC